MDNPNRRADDNRAPGQLQWSESGEAAAPAAGRFGYTITPRAAHVGGGWRLQLLEDGQEVGGGIYPVTEEVTSDDAHQEAMDDGEAWLMSRGDGAATEPNNWADFIKGCGYTEVAPGRFEKPKAAPASADNPSTAGAELHIGVSNNDQGVHINIMQRHADGTATVIYAAKAPSGDS